MTQIVQIPVPTNTVRIETAQECAGEVALDEALDESFPASDPVAIDTGPPVKIADQSDKHT